MESMDAKMILELVGYLGSGLVIISMLMTSVDTDAAVCAQERQALFARLGAGTWQIVGGHGGMKLYKVAPASV